MDACALYQGLTNDQVMQASRLQAEITVLREARECVTDTATPAAIYGRVDGLISFRQERLLEIYQRARGATPQEATHRG